PAAGVRGGTALRALQAPTDGDPDGTRARGDPAGGGAARGARRGVRGQPDQAGGQRARARQQGADAAGDRGAVEPQEATGAAGRCRCTGGGGVLRAAAAGAARRVDGDGFSPRHRIMPTRPSHSTGRALWRRGHGTRHAAPGAWLWMTARVPYFFWAPP